MCIIDIKKVVPKKLRLFEKKFGTPFLKFETTLIFLEQLLIF